MKRFLALAFAVLMIFTCAACAEKPTEDAAIIAFYSVKSAEGEFIVEVQDLGGVYSELYDKDGLYVTFTAGEKIVDKDGNPIKREDLNYGDTLEIHYSGELHHKNPKTIKAYKIVKVM